MAWAMFCFGLLAAFLLGVLVGQRMEEIKREGKR